MPPAAAIGVALAATAIGTGIKVFGGIQESKQIKATAEFNARQKENEAITVEGERSENNRRTRVRNRRLLGAQRAKIGAAGVTEEGSPLELMAATAGELELEVLDLNREAESRKIRLRNEAGIIRFEGKKQAKAAKIGAIGSGIAGVTRIASIIPQAV